MEEQQFVEYLQHFGLGRQEAVVYQKLLIQGKCTGYEIAKETGISRSNVYSALAALVEKGAAYLVEESAKRYIPVNLEEFCDNALRRMKSEKEWMLMHLPREKVEEEGYITIEGMGNVRDKIRNLLDSVDERVYFSATAKYLGQYAKELNRLLKNKKKVVLITDHEIDCFPGALVYISEDKGSQIGIITDSKYVLTGEYGEECVNTCLYSGQKNFVTLFKNALANEIKLIQKETDHE